METVVNVEGTTWQDTAADISQHALALMEENPVREFVGVRAFIGGGNNMINICITLTNAVSESGHLPYYCEVLTSLKSPTHQICYTYTAFNGIIKPLLIIIITFDISKSISEMYNIN